MQPRFGLDVLNKLSGLELRSKFSFCVFKDRDEVIIITVIMKMIIINKQ